MCGEHAARTVNQLNQAGSSPRVWGAPTRLHPRRRRTRLIPTCVGSTVEGFRRHFPVAAHPHVCGEHLRWWSMTCTPFGSSPRVWGARYLSPPEPLKVRLIPTCVGSTHPSCRRLNPKAAHPHVCGEHVVAFLRPVDSDGSSPRVWGAHLLTWDFIPTHQVLELVWSPKPVLTLHDFWAYRRREARLYLLALLHPFRGPRSSFGADGRIISFTPSKSTGSHG